MDFSEHHDCQTGVNRGSPWSQDMLASSLNKTSVLVSSHLDMCEFTTNVYENDSFVKITPGYDVTDHG